MLTAEDQERLARIAVRSEALESAAADRHREKIVGAERERLRSLLDSAEIVITDLEWSGRIGPPWSGAGRCCPVCRAVMAGGRHAEGCALGGTLAALRTELGKETS